MGFVDGFHNKYQTGGLQHLLAKQVRLEVGAGIFSDYYRFSIVRNPWDKAVSQFVYMSRRNDLQDFLGMSSTAGFKTYLDLISRKRHVQWMPQIDFLLDDDGQTLVNYIGRYETYRRSVADILTALGLDPNIQVPHANRSDRGVYQDYYDDESQQMVASLYAADIAHFGYRYEGIAEARQQR